VFAASHHGRELQARSDVGAGAVWRRCTAPASILRSNSPQSESSVGRFLLGFIVAIILVLYVAARCVGAIT
jgi:hypothetical protein